MKIQYFLKNKNNFLILSFLLCVLLNNYLFSGEISIPQLHDKYINDFAQIFTSADKKALSERLEYLEKNKNITFMVSIFNSIRDYTDDGEDFDAFIDKYLILSGLNEKDNGVAFVVFIKDRKMKIKLGAYYNGLYQFAVEKVLRTKVIPEFKKNNFGRGIYLGTFEIISIISKDVNLFNLYKYYLISSLLIIFVIFFIIFKRFLDKKSKKETPDDFVGGVYGSWK